MNANERKILNRKKTSDCFLATSEVIELGRCFLITEIKFNTHFNI